MTESNFDNARAVLLIREKAQRAEQGRWKIWGTRVIADPKGTSNITDSVPVANVIDERSDNASHIAGFDPRVAMHVANLLDCPCQEHADALAHAYLDRSE